MQHLNIMIKPASGLCNMRCKYCFYYDIMDHRDIDHHGIMSDATTKEIIEKAFREKVGHITFIFQGGEPLIAGYDYFSMFVKIVNQQKSHIQVSYTIQTNGTSLTNEIVKLFKENNFLVGISIDGPKEVHDIHRFDHLKSGSFESVMNGLRLLKRHNVDFNVLSVITNQSVMNVKGIYEFIKDLGTDYLQFIPCIDDFDQDQKALSSENYGKFYMELFDLWYDDYKQGRVVNIQYFDNIIRMGLGMQPLSCTLFGNCIVHIVIEANGDVFPCDFYMIDEWRLGNIKEMSLSDIVTSKLAKQFIMTSLDKNEDCKVCKYYNLCKGGCRRNKEPFIEVRESKTRFCEGVKSFLDYSFERFKEISNDIVKRNL